VGMGSRGLSIQRGSGGSYSLVPIFSFFCFFSWRGGELRGRVRFFNEHVPIVSRPVIAEVML